MVYVTIQCSCNQHMQYILWTIVISANRSEFLLENLTSISHLNHPIKNDNSCTVRKSMYDLNNSHLKSATT